MTHSPTPWWTDGVYDLDEGGCSIIAARTDCGPLPGNPTRGQVAFATELLPEKASECEANAKFIVRAVNAHDDLVAALKAFIATSEATISFNAKDRDNEYNIARAKAALAKAGA